MRAGAREAVVGVRAVMVGPVVAAAGQVARAGLVEASKGG